MKVIKHSHILPGEDASILACLAQSAHLSSNQETRAMIEDLSCQCTKQLARNIVAGNTKDPTAKAFLDWANSLAIRNL